MKIKLKQITLFQSLTISILKDEIKKEINLKKNIKKQSKSIHQANDTDHQTETTL